MIRFCAASKKLPANPFYLLTHSLRDCCSLKGVRRDDIEGGFYKSSSSGKRET
ncbi:hypothetical protein Syun_029586 [Stephania yunnanensis]|uniref:Uncharacterized protein n=1 Tax=Stephania yunnanensis TaxID=152371 RepID=A0AAP0HJM6_9MAGN